MSGATSEGALTSSILSVPNQGNDFHWKGCTVGSGTTLRARDPLPQLQRVASGDIFVLTDPDLRQRTGILVAFTERTGGVSSPPYDSLNLATHVGDRPECVDENRSMLMRALDIESLRNRIVTAEQVHSSRVVRVAGAQAGAGAFASGAAPLAAIDALVTDEPGVPLLMLYADCVPIVLVAEGPRAAVAVVHSGWRGTLARVIGNAVKEIAAVSGASPSSISAYIGPHIGVCCYQVDDTLVSQFCNGFDTITAVDGHLDLGAAVVESMECLGVRRDRIVTPELCTRDLTDRYFSYRARQVTGRHGALAVITKVE